MMGMDDQTGKSISEAERIRRSIRDIVLTPKGTRVLKRDYGCDLFKLVDSPINSSLRIAAAETVISALRRWEPRVRVQRVELRGATDDVVQGQISVNVYYEYDSKTYVEGIAIR